MLQRLARHAATLPATIVAATALVVAIGERSGPALAVVLAVALIAGLAIDRTRLAARLPRRESVVGHDVADELLAQQALTASERRYRSIADHARVGIYDVDFSGDAPRFRYVNPALAEMCGIPAQAWYDDMHVARFHVPEEDQRELGIDAANRTTTLPEPARYRWIRPDGEVRWHEVAEVPIRDGDGQMLSVQGIIHDVTDLVEERNVLAEALASKDQAVRDLERIAEMKNTFLQSVSHELRTPLTGIVGLSTTLRERSAVLGPEARWTMHDAIHRNATKLQTLLADLLDVDRLARGIVEPRLEETDLATLTWNVVSGLDVDDRRITTDLRSAPVRADGPKVERIVENLLMNAVRHTPVGATVHVATGPVGDCACLVVEDTGPGIADRLKPALFEPFVQGPASSRTASPGTGIGLALVAQFTELHGGAVRVEDSDSGGARFVVELPLLDLTKAARTA